MEESQSEKWLPMFSLVTLLSPNECGRAIRELPMGSLVPATRLTDGETMAQVVDPAYRVAMTRRMSTGDALYELLLSRVVEKLPQINAPYQFRLHDDPRKMMPNIAFNRYDAGDPAGHHAYHCDTAGHPVTQERKLSLVLSLSATGSYAGGHLQLNDGNIEFPLMNEVEGTACVFHSLTLHRVVPMVDGTRYSCVIWLMGPRFT